MPLTAYSMPWQQQIVDRHALLQQAKIAREEEEEVLREAWENDLEDWKTSQVMLWSAALL